MEMLRFTIEDRRNQLQSWKSNVCHINRFHRFVHDSCVFVERIRKQVHFDSSIEFIDSCSSHLNRRGKHQQNHDDDKRSNDDVSVLRGGSGGVGIGGNHGLGVDGECMSDRVLKLSFELIAFPNAATKPSDDNNNNNNNNMRTTDNDDKTTEAR